jgi:hypothetical protein
MSDSPVFLFVHVMKTGGTSLVFQLLEEFPGKELYPSASVDRRHPTDAESYGSIPDLVALTPERRAAIRMYAGHFPYMARELIGGELTTLTLLREPVARTISLLKHFKRLYERYSELSLDEIYEDPFVFRHFIENHQTKVFSVAIDDRPKTIAGTVSYREIRAYLTGSPADPDPAAASATPDTITIDAGRLARAKSNLALVDVIGVNDRFQSFVEALHVRFGWWPAGLAGEARANASSEPWDASAALRARIARENRFDVELYEYANELAQ